MKMLCSLCIIGIVCSLTSCATLKARKLTARRCETTAAVYGDLQRPYGEQTYYLSNGVHCPDARSAT